MNLNQNLYIRFIHECVAMLFSRLTVMSTSGGERGGLLNSKMTMACVCVCV